MIREYDCLSFSVQNLNGGLNLHKAKFLGGDFMKEMKVSYRKTKIILL